jgi:hypothetical protein
MQHIVNIKEKGSLYAKKEAVPAQGYTPGFRTAPFH